MKYYAKYMFIQCPTSPYSYVLKDHYGEGPDIPFSKFAETPRNVTNGIAGLQYIHFGIPRSESMRKYFANTFEGLRGKPITSTETLNQQNRTFGDAKQLGRRDLILFEFSSDMKFLSMWFVRNKGNTRWEKKDCFDQWVNGEELIPEN